MNATVKQLRAFVAVAKTRSLAQASAQLHVSQPALSISIRNLEATVGGPLFSRDSRQLALTPEGAEFLGRAEQLLRSWDQSLDALQQRFRLQRGQLALAVIPAFALNRLPPLLAAFHREHPQINIILEDVVMERVVQSLLEGRAELGISFRPDDLSGLEFIPFDEDRFVAITPAGHPLAGRKSLRWVDLAASPFIAMNRGSAVRRWTDQAFVEAGRDMQLFCEASQLSTIGQMVREGLGVSVVPSLCEPQMRELGLAVKALTAPAVTQEVGALIRNRGGLSAPARAFLQLLQPD
ncbi:LysR family transcriptional regulator [Microbulbifer flavimaris]|uniref:LysR family transcriptional regulator n=1 Tax=Microbulbifer flavimaris TaxID=1781068 RepID=A0ABX4HVE1_9GAMM|nr:MULTISPECIES: LysR family transcriptional regulator [Microbulbifer]KUJ79152.1 LysR family transcriptional regulator [Microbulbifer sp. ZGT114]PCO04074.1 LysR family transcriptional regulator [Microbulbifer flavimaris]